MACIFNVKHITAPLLSINLSRPTQEHDDAMIVILKIMLFLLVSIYMLRMREMFYNAGDGLVTHS